MLRQANTILRLTVVTIFAMIATIGTGFLGMNLIAAADQPFLWRVVFFVIVLAVTGGITGFTIVRSKRLADLLDVLSDERVGGRRKWHAFGASVRRYLPLACGAAASAQRERLPIANRSHDRAVAPASPACRAAPGGPARPVASGGPGPTPSRSRHTISCRAVVFCPEFTVPPLFAIVCALAGQGIPSQRPASARPFEARARELVLLAQMRERRAIT